MVHLENQLEVNESIGDAEGAATAKANTAHAKSKYEGDNNEELLKANEELYELRVSKFGDDDEDTIHTGLIYASNLQKANRGGEARDLLMKLLATSKQVLGPRHNTAKKVEKELKKVIEVADQE